MTRPRRPLFAIAAGAALVTIGWAAARAVGSKLPTPIPPELITPERVDTRLGALELKDGAPERETVDKLYDNLDFVRAIDAFLNAFQGASMVAIRQGFLAAGVEDDAVLIFSELMDARSLFLTANADTIYYLSFVDLTKGPMVVETPPMALGTIDDMWFRWVTDFGLPGPDRGAGGKYLILPPGWKGELPEGGFTVAQARTNRVAVLGRSFMEHDNPKPVVETIRKGTGSRPSPARAST
jgi:hypothetical protein